MVKPGDLFVLKGAQLRVLGLSRRTYCTCCKSHVIARCEVVALMPMHADSPAKAWDVGWTVELDARVVVKATLP